MGVSVEDNFNIIESCKECGKLLPDSSRNLEQWEQQKDGSWICDICLEDIIMGGEKGV